jgi:glycerol-3-phosphate dehydrogenase
LQVSALCNTQTHLLVGAQGWTTDLAANLESEYGLDADVCVHLSRKYGARAREVAHLAQKEAPLAKRIIPEYAAICAEIVYAVRMEMACKVRDFLARRIRLEMTDWALARKATPAVAHLMGAELGWSEQETRQQATEYLALLESFENRSKGRM